jgi:hypothetical protein
MRNSSILNDPPVTLFFLAIATALSTVVCINLASKEATPVSFAICQLKAAPFDILVLNSASPDLTAERISLKVLFAKSPLVSILSAILMYYKIDIPSASLSRFLYCAVCISTSSGVDPANISSIFAYLPFFLVPFIV